jgi:hypothetical protein
MSSASEADRHQRKMEAAGQLPGAEEQLSMLSTLYQDRGLAPDTSVQVGNSIERALKVQKEQGFLESGRVRRVAVVGPGLDFTDKLEGFDVYPQQSIQPFAVIDSLVRLGLAAPDLCLTTFDINPRITLHLENARRKASAGEGYVLQVSLTRDRLGRERHPDVVKYWEVLGRDIGAEVAPILPTGEAADVRMRAVAVKPAVVTSIEPIDLNIVVERHEIPLNDRFDLVVATNVLVYYSSFEQSLVLANLARMIRPGGFLVTNYPVPTSDAFGSSPLSALTVPWDSPPSQDGDTVYSYRRR